MATPELTVLVDQRYVDPAPTLLDLGSRRVNSGIVICDDSVAFESSNWLDAQLHNERVRTRCVAQLGNKVVRFTDELFSATHPNVELRID